MLTIEHLPTLISRERVRSAVDLLSSLRHDADSGSFFQHFDSVCSDFKLNHDEATALFLEGLREDRAQYPQRKMNEYLSACRTEVERQIVERVFAGLRLDVPGDWGDIRTLDSVIVGKHEQLGKGRTGRVFKATKRPPGKQVAVKIIEWIHPDLSLDEKKREIGRLSREIKALAKLSQSTRIVHIDDVGILNDHVALVMDYLPGGSLEDRKGDFVQPRKAAALVQDIAGLVQQVHNSRLLHRDIKPSNILFNSDGDPVLSDFGFAKELDRQGNEDFTKTAEVLGSPGFLSPEQASGERATEKSDVFALGATLYYLVTGSYVFTLDPPREYIRRVQSEDAIPPSTRRRERGWSDLPPQLEAVILRSIERYPRERYASASDFAEELGRYLRGEPVHAGRFNPVRSIKWWLKRNSVVAAFAALLLLVCGYAVTATVLFNREARAVRGAHVWRASGEPDPSGRLLSAAFAARADNYYLPLLMRAVQETPSTLILSETMVCAVDFSSVSNTLASAHQNGDVLLWNSVTGKPLGPLMHQGGRVSTAVRFSHKSDLLAVSNSNGYVAVYSAKDGKLLRLLSSEIRKSRSDVLYSVSVAFILQDTQVAALDIDGTIRVWNLETGTPRITFRSPNQYENDLVSSGDGLYLGGINSVRDATSLSEALPGSSALVGCLAFSRDGTMCASCGGGRLRVYNTLTRTICGDYAIPTGYRARCVFSPDDTLYLMNGAEIHKYDTANGIRLATMSSRSGVSRSLAVSPDGSALAVGGGRLVLFRELPNAHRIETGFADRVRAMAISPDASLIAAVQDEGGGEFNGVSVLDRVTGRRVSDLASDSPIQALRFFADSRHLLTGDADGRITVWNALTGDKAAEWKPHSASILGIAISGDDRRISSIGVDGILQVSSIESGDRVSAVSLGALPHVAASRPAGEPASVDGHSLSLNSIIRRGNTMSLRWPLPLQFAFNGDAVAAFAPGTGVVLWRPAESAEPVVLGGHHRKAANTLVFSDDDRALICATPEGSLEGWRIPEGVSAFPLITRNSPCCDAKFVSGTKLIASIWGDGALRVYDENTAELRQEMNLNPRNDYRSPLAGSLHMDSKGARIVVIWNDGRLHVVKRDPWTQIANVDLEHFSGEGSGRRSNYGGISSAAVSSSCKFAFVCANRNTEIYVWQLDIAEWPADEYMSRAEKRIQLKLSGEDGFRPVMPWRK